MDWSQVIEILNQLAQPVLAFFTIGLVVATILLWCSTRRYARATENLLLVTQSYAKATEQMSETMESQKDISKKQVGIIEKQTEIMEEQKNISEKQNDIINNQTKILDRQANINDLIVDLQYMRYLEVRKRKERDRIIKIHSPSDRTDPMSVVLDTQLADSLPTIIRSDAEKELAGLHEMLSALYFKFDKHKDRVLSELTPEQREAVEKIKKENLGQDIDSISLLLQLKYIGKRYHS